MDWPGATVGIYAVFAVLSAFLVSRKALKKHSYFDSYLNHTWIYFLSFAVCERVSVTAGIWILALVSFWALREYFSLIHIRLQDRVGILVAYLSIPFMFYFIQIDWYGMFIVSIPVYAYLAIPLFVSLGGRETKGIVFSVGALNFGLFLFVYCLGHIGYLALYSRWMAGMVVLSVLLCDAATHCLEKSSLKGSACAAACYLVPVPLTIGLALTLAPWTEIPVVHCIALGLLIPMLALIGHRTIDCIQSDLGVRKELLAPGRGQTIDTMRSLFYVAPVTFHYIRYFLT